MLDEQMVNFQTFPICRNWCPLHEMHLNTCLMHAFAHGFCAQSTIKVTHSAPAYCIEVVVQVLGVRQGVML